MPASRTFVPRDTFLPVSRPTIRQAEIDEVVDTLESGWLTTGPKADRFERAFGEYTSAPVTLAVSSATAGLHIGLLALGVAPGDEVITTPITWAATVNMIEMLGARPVFADVHPDTLQIDPEAVAAAVTERTVGILPVHFAGAPCDLDPLLALARKHGLWVFEDAAHGVGTRYKGRHVGSFDRLGVFSFHPIKNMTTGEGGALTLGDPTLAAALRALRFHGLEKSAWNRYAEGGSPQVEVVRPGFKYNFTDIQAALGIHQLAAVDELNAARSRLAARYDELLARFDAITRPGRVSYDHESTWHLYVIQVGPSARMSRDAFMAGLRKRNVGTGLHFKAVHREPYYAARYPEWLGRLPHAERASDRLCSLPLYPLLTEEDQRYVVDAIEDVLSHDAE